MKNHNTRFSDELWAAIQKAAAIESAKRDKPLTVSEWIRETLAARVPHGESGP